MNGDEDEDEEFCVTPEALEAARREVDNDPPSPGLTDRVLKAVRKQERKEVR